MARAALPIGRILAGNFSQRSSGGTLHYIEADRLKLEEKTYEKKELR